MKSKRVTILICFATVRDAEDCRVVIFIIIDRCHARIDEGKALDNRRRLVDAATLLFSIQSEFEGAVII